MRRTKVAKGGKNATFWSLFSFFLNEHARARTECLPKGGPPLGAKCGKNSAPGGSVSWGKIAKIQIFLPDFWPENAIYGCASLGTETTGGPGGVPPAGDPGGRAPRLW